MDTNNSYADVAIDHHLTIADTTVDTMRMADPFGSHADLVEALVAKTRPLLVADALDPAILQRPPIALVLTGDVLSEAAHAADHAAAQLQLEGYVVLRHQLHDDGWDQEDQDMMDALLRHKIDMADVVNIANPEGIAVAVLPFIEYAENTSTPVQYSDPQL